jgi:hypothetical protein
VLKITASPDGPFDINRADGDGPSARFPQPIEAYKSQVLNLDTYLMAMRSSMADVAAATEGALTEVVKALGVPPQAYSYATASFMPDPANAGLLPWPGIAPESLRKIARENIAPQLVIRARVADLARYSGLSHNIWEPGWQVGMRVASETPTAQDRADIRDAERFVWNCNRESSYSDARERDAHLLHPFDMFLRAFGDDTHTFDGWAVWTDMTRDGKVKAFANLPAGQVRLAVPGRGVAGNPRFFSALVDETGNPVKPLTRDEMFWAIRNPRNDPNTWGYGFPESEIAILMIQAFQSAIQLNNDTFCYSEDTEVLTAEGWKYFSGVDIEHDTFATLNTDSGAFEYQRATEQVWEDYEGDIYNLKSRSVDLLVTPNHRIVTVYRPTFYTHDRKNYDVTNAAAFHEMLQGMAPVSRYNYCLPAFSSWGGTEIGEKTFVRMAPQYKTGTRVRVSGDDYCAFMGMYLSEGSLNRQAGDKDEDAKSRIQIHQCRKSKGFEPFRALLARMIGHEPSYTDQGERFYVGWRGLAEHVALFGKDCYTKFIPQEILDATPRQQKIFWDFFVYGDGCISYRQSVNANRPHAQEHIATTSRRMADQLQEIAQKMGFAATIHRVDAAKYTHGHIKGRPIKSVAVRYDVYLKKSPLQAVDTEKGVYRGKIGCVTVPNGTLYVRRGGKAIWCGNSRNSIPNGIMLLKGDFWNQSQLDAIMREWTNMKRGVSKMWGVPVMSVPEGAEVEVMPLMDLKGQEIRYRDHINLMGGLYCVVSQFPPRRLGIFASGMQRDSAPVQNESVEQAGVDDPGLPPLLGFAANRVNEYLVQPNWPRLRMWFNGANPKQDAREYEARKQARTWGESRAEVDLKKLTDGVPAKYRPLVEVMQYCPEDSSKISAFSVLAAKWLETQAPKPDEDDGEAGAAAPGPDGKPPDAPFPSKTDPAASQSHGHRSGVRRDGAAEEASAEAAP